MELPPWIVALGVLVPPVPFAYVQNELNRLWAIEGQPLDPWPAALASEPADSSTAPLLWLKTKAHKPADTHRRMHRRSAVWASSSAAPLSSHPDLRSEPSGMLTDTANAN
jgi:hypothetical protein